eukprot:3721461-Rhodomonas_salina.2
MFHIIAVKMMMTMMMLRAVRRDGLGRPDLDAALAAPARGPWRTLAALWHALHTASPLPPARTPPNSTRGALARLEGIARSNDGAETADGKGYVEIQNSLPDTGEAALWPSRGAFSSPKAAHTNPTTRHKCETVQIRPLRAWNWHWH